MHLSINNLVLDFPINSPSIENFSRIIYSFISNVHNSTKFIFRIRLPSSFEEAEHVYRQYLTLKRLCSYHTTGLGGVLLEFDEDLPDWEHYLQRWTSEKVFGILLDTRVFMFNQKNFPVLSIAHQHACKEFMKQNVRFVLRGKDPNDDLD